MPHIESDPSPYLDSRGSHDQSPGRPDARRGRASETLA